MSSLETLKQNLSAPSGQHPIIDLLYYWNQNPSSGEPIRILAEYFRKRQLYHLADLFNSNYEKYGSGTPEYDNYSTQIENSIVGFYLNERGKQLGHQACDSLSLNPAVDASIRVMSRNNLLWYAKSISEIFDNLTFTQMHINNTDKYILLNPSIAWFNKKRYMIQRTVNYHVTEEGYYVPHVDDNIRTRNWLCELDENYNIVKKTVIEQPTDWPEAKYGGVLGFEDSRLFTYKDELWTSSTVRELSEDGRAQIVLARLDVTESTVRYADWHAVTPTYTKELKYEKNWVPVADDSVINWVYSSDPTRIIDENGETKKLVPNILAAEHWRGGTQAIPFNGGWLYLIHETIIPTYSTRTYLHRFVWCNSDWQVSKISDAFYFKSKGLEFAAGLILDNDSVVVSFGYLDKESWIVKIPSNLVTDALRSIEDPITAITNNRNYAEKWTAEPLRTDAEWAKAKEILANANLPTHKDSPKNWDNFVSLYYCLTTTQKTDPILDCGATTDSALLPGLYRCGYLDLTSLNLSQPQDEVINGVLYRPGDITKTEYPDNHFGFVACLSVIEHGVDQQKFFQEMIRVMKKGAKLCISTDYWEVPVNTAGLKMFGADMVLFTPDDVNNMIKIAKKQGFKVLGNFNPQVNSTPVIKNMGVEYTFAMLVFEK